MSLLKADWDTIERAIEKMLNDHMRTWGSYDYFVIDDVTILVKVYAEGNNRLMFTIKAKLAGEKLEVVEVS
ncbi:hypothetical protein YN1551_1498 [Sulfolobus islandicus Y.N.15.51]|uniref:Uncharacterized protein n=2 Tax=Saccharolobus islandicus TaxID=43080 RepID=C3NHH7_SACI1|nr:hypothetical protein YN1551_1498 [Sulfolobus islandicus Y.N.15.51]